MHVVEVRTKGYEYKGTRYESLSEIARLITGTRWSGPLFFGLQKKSSACPEGGSMTSESKKVTRCAIYTRKSSEEGLEQSFNSLDAQREACEAYHRQSKTRRLANASCGL